MTEVVDLEPLLLGFLVFARVGGLLMALPVTGSRSVPAIARLAAALPLAAVLYPTVEGTRAPATIPDLLVTSVLEVGVGVAMGFVVGLVIGALAMASEVIGMKIGLSLGGMLDPITGTQGNPLGALSQMLATGLFFALDMHLACVRTLGESLTTVPPGTIVAPLAGGEVLLNVASSVLVLGVRLAAPVVAFAFLVNLALMTVGRMAPGLQVFFSIGMSLTLMAGMVVFAAAVPAMLMMERDALAGLIVPIRALLQAVSGG
ncbi:MAG: flagellar biosynthetic protein FliR [Deltaproteobacteria bacterium]|nr:flagellar biosynthetic protein FliR [Deltaproteobacteria bacterium]